MNLLHKTEELSRFENELFLLLSNNSKNSSFSNRDNFRNHITEYLGKEINNCAEICETSLK